MTSPLSLAFALIAFGATLAILAVGAATSRCEDACTQETRVAKDPVRPLFAPNP